MYTQKKKFSQYLCFLMKSTILHISLSNFIHELYYRNFTRGVQKIRGQMLPFLHWLSNRTGITAHNTVTYMQLIGYNMLGVSRLRA